MLKLNYRKLGLYKGGKRNLNTSYVKVKPKNLQ